MKLLFTIFLLPVVFVCCDAQPNGKFEEWGKVTMDELKMKECPFEKDANALLLLNLGQAYYEVGYGSMYFTTGRFLMTTACYQRVKIFNASGCKRAEIHLRYKTGKKIEQNYNVATNDEDIKDIRAVTYNATWDGEGMQKTELDPADIHRTKLNDFEWEISFTVPAVKPGSVFEFEYKRTQFVFLTLPTWNFCTDMPCVKSSISIGFLDAVTYYTEQFLNHIEYKKFSLPFTSSIKVPASAQRSWGMINKDFLTGTTITYTAINIASVRDEPYINSLANYTDRVSFQLKSINPPFAPYDGVINTWNRYTDDLLGKPNFGGRLSEGGLPENELKSVINETMTGEEKARAIFEYIRNNVNWDGVDTIMATNNNLKTWKNKTGNSAEINFLLINTLREAGLTANPCLVNSRSTGYTNMNYPISDQFGELVAVYESGDNGRLFLDATDKFTPFGITRYDLTNNFCLSILGAGSSVWLNTFKGADNTEIAIINARLDTTGKIQGEILAFFDNYTEAKLRELKATKQDSLFNVEIKRRTGNINIESVLDTFDAARNRFVHKAKFTSQIVKSNDSLVYLSLSGIYGQTENPFVSSHRISDVDFGYMQRLNTTLTIELPTGYELDSSPKPMVLLTPDSSIYYRFGAQQNDNVLYVQQKLEYHKSTYPAGDYPTFYEFHKQYYTLMQEPVVLRRKPRGG